MVNLSPGAAKGKQAGKVENCTSFVPPGSPMEDLGKMTEAGITGRQGIIENIGTDGMSAPRLNTQLYNETRRTKTLCGHKNIRYK